MVEVHLQLAVQGACFLFVTPRRAPSIHNRTLDCSSGNSGKHSSRSKLTAQSFKQPHPAKACTVPNGYIIVGIDHAGCHYYYYYQYTPRALGYNFDLSSLTSASISIQFANLLTIYYLNIHKLCPLLQIISLYKLHPSLSVQTPLE